jgi:hypothetical protein
VNCLVIAHLSESYMASEVQELVSGLGAAGYKVRLLQHNVTGLELYRVLDWKSYKLVWLVCHSTSEGFLFSSGVLKPYELGLFLSQASTQEVVLNSCYSSEHVAELQRYAPTATVIATILEEVEDSEAATIALYLGRKISEGKDLKTSYLETLVSSDTNYRWFPAVKVGDAMSSESQFNEIQREIGSLKIQVDKLSREVETLVFHIQGDKVYRQKGVIERIENIETNIAIMEQRVRDASYLTVSRASIIFIALITLVLTVGILFMTYLLGG